MVACFYFSMLGKTFTSYWIFLDYREKALELSSGQHHRSAQKEILNVT